ncbi:hypothetical protein DCE79_14450 [Lysinibacillus sp. 2017]|uniref:HD-GYP domain-containing protein n=1 Tax=unclassified Lysinibacillus TaxID=2636778 RepID=UPI000D52A129|nr:MULTISPECIES: HD domain-containing phosphohydrolase [unclassified Lysinibacillus]AWE08495.1 hypothetical protein DCE79_14450 [Lysinibacillus sp. 2017]TGN31618.1 HD domain-containing protein [Lysinibacillus sp. S2017]
MQQKKASTNYEICFINDLKSGQIVYEDVFVEQRCLLAKGHVLTDRIITILKNRNVQQVMIEKALTTNHSDNSAMNIIEQMKYELGHDFLKVLGTLSSETRYGKALNNSEDVHFLKNLLANYMENPMIYKLFTNLKNHDESTYLHSMDVFTLGTLFALSEGITNIEEIALGYLFHDIGKMNITSTLLNKKERLTKEEYAAIQSHPTKGYQLLCSNGFEHIAHFAKSHNERLDGSGYPEGLTNDQLSHEMQILQIVDVYSAITMKRSYKDGVAAVIAMEKLIKQHTKFDSNLVYRFIDLIGIYPENAVVLLSDGNQAIVEKVNSLYPLLPTVKVIQTSETFQMPMDFSLSINKMITCQVDTPQQLFSKFSDFLLNNDEEQMIRYYKKLKVHYHKSEWFTHIYLPVLHIFRVMENYNMVPEVRFEEVKNKLLTMIEKTLKSFRQNHHHHEKILLLTEDQNTSAIIQIFEGILHNHNIYPFISIVNQSKEAIENMIMLCKAEKLIVIGDSFKDMPTSTIQYYHLTEQQLEGLLSRYSSTDVPTHQLLNDLGQFLKTEHLLWV